MVVGFTTTYAIRVRGVMISTTFNNISVISWRAALLLEYTEKTPDLPYVTVKLYYIMLWLSGIRTHDVSDDKY
jgi:hypothetical protein